MVKVKEIKKFLEQFDDEDKVFIECCIKDSDDNTLEDKEYKGTYEMEIMNGQPYQIEQCNYGLCDVYGDVELMFSTKEY